MSENQFANKKILVTGGAGFLGKHVIAQLTASGANPDLITVPRSKEHDLRSLAACEQVVQGQDLIIHLAAHVGGIGLNMKKPAELFYDN